MQRRVVEQRAQWLLLLLQSYGRKLILVFPAERTPCRLVFFGESPMCSTTHCSNCKKGRADMEGGTINIQYNHLVFMRHTVHAHLLISAAKVGLVPFKYLTESHFVFPRIHHTGVVVLQEGLSSCSKLAVNILTRQV